MRSTDSLGGKKKQNPDSGKDWRQKKNVAGDDMFRQYDWYNEHESEQIMGDN